MLATTNSNAISILPFPLTAGTGKTVSWMGEPASAHFFSHDGKTLFAAIGKNLFAVPILPGFQLGQRELLFPWQYSDRLNARIGAASRDGNRFLLIDTDKADEIHPQILTDWTTLLPK